MTLEDTIKTLTARTPSGGSCQIGEACFSVYYSTDSWEWEYQGVTYFDPIGLAGAIRQSLGAPSKRALYHSGEAPERRRVARP